MGTSKELKASLLGYYGQVYAGAVLLTTSDTVDLVTPSRALYIGGAGNVKMITAAGDTITFTAVPVGTILPIVATRVYATLTTATNIIALY